MTDKEAVELTSAIAYAMVSFGRHKYWTDELFRKVKGRKDIDVTELIVATVHSAAYQQGIYVRPMGSGWTSACTKKEAEEYLAKYQDIWDDYAEWQWNQR